MSPTDLREALRTVTDPHVSAERECAECGEWDVLDEHARCRSCRLCRECGEELLGAGTGYCARCYRADPLNQPGADE